VRTTKFLLSLVLLLAGYQLPLRAQTATSATVLGRVTDTAGGVLGGAKVTLHNLSTNAKREQKTNGEGTYVYANVAPGTYTLEVKSNCYGAVTAIQREQELHGGYFARVRRCRHRDGN
jgi:hypothetical protein